MDEKDEEEVVVVAVVMRYDNSGISQANSYRCRQVRTPPSYSSMETAMFSWIAGKDHSDPRSTVISTDHLFLNISWGRSGTRVAGAVEGERREKRVLNQEKDGGMGIRI